MSSYRNSDSAEMSFEAIQLSYWTKPLIVTMLCILFALSFGVFYGRADQNIYMLGGIRLADPSLFQRDWYVSEIIHHHKAFAYIVSMLLKVGPLWLTSAILHLLLMAIVALSTYAILRALYECLSLSFLFSAILLHLVVGSSNLLSHPFFVPWLLPTGIASAFFLAGIAFLSHAMPERLSLWFWSGLLFGLSGFIHGTFLFLIPLFLLGTLIALRRRFLLREIVAFSVPYLVLTLPMGWLVLSQFVFQEVGENAIEKLDTFARFRIPHHYLPREWGIEGFGPFLKHAILGVIGLFVLWPNGKRASVVLAATASLMGIFAFVFFFTVVIFVPHVALLQAFRFASSLSYFSLLFFAGALAQEVVFKSELFSPRGLKRLVLLGIGLIVVYQMDCYLAVGLAVLLSVCLIVARCRLSVHTYLRLTHLVVLCGAVLFLSWQTKMRFPLSVASLVPFAAGEFSLFQWIRNNTSRDAVFVVPPAMQRFRLHTQRSIVVDWKGHPFRIGDIREWFRRLSMVSGVVNPTSKRELLFGYLSLDSDRAYMLAQEFGAQYVVVREHRHWGNLNGLNRVYSRHGYALYCIEKR